MPSKQISLQSPITTLPMVGDSYAKKLENLHIRTIKDLIYHLPASYKDTTDIITVQELQERGEGVVKVHIADIKLNFTRTRKAIVKAKVTDPTGSVNVMWFNQRFIVNSIKKDNYYLMSLKKPNKPNATNYYCQDYEQIQHEDYTDTTHLGRITAVYNQTKGVSSKWLRARIKQITPELARLVPEYLPPEVLTESKLIPLQEAFNLIHTGETHEQLQQAKDRIALEEMLELAHFLEQRRKEREEGNTYNIGLSQAEYEKFQNHLPFTLTDDQKTSIEEILDDMSSQSPMNRLLNGDVGSGKTAVATLIALATVQSGYTTIIMAPTTILAQQHYKTLTELLTPYQEIADIQLVTSQSAYNIPEEPHIVVGTHALLYQEELPENIGLVIIDEQHRFGVEQRNQLATIGEDTDKKPHYLTMTATPIPRTLTNVLYGDMDVSFIKQLPKERLPVVSHFVPDSKQQDAYNWIHNQIANNDAQAFIVFPLIDESEKMDLKAATQSYDLLSKTIFKDIDLELLHGKLKEEEKIDILKRFKDKEIKVLLSTTVIEVGIDIPDATVMVIENAERFGLAQLHQLRGRVGRGNKQAYCLLMPGPNVGPYSQAAKRLKYFAKHTSGFDIAEYDLKLRGPGEVYGLKQSGIPEFKAADMLDEQLLKQARTFIKQNPGIKPSLGLFTAEQ